LSISPEVKAPPAAVVTVFTVVVPRMTLTVAPVRPTDPASCTTPEMAKYAGVAVKVVVEG
jgi:hypothetical protein